MQHLSALKDQSRVLKRVKDFKGGGKTDFAERAIQSFKLLLTQQGLFNDIQKFREKWGITVPIDQIISEISPEFQDMGEVDFFDPESVNNNPLFKEIAERMEYERLHPKTDEEIERREQKFQDMDSLMKKYKIDSIYFELFRDFVETGRLFLYYFRQSNETGTYFFRTTNVNGESIMAIGITPETTLEDIEAEWPEIELYRDKFLGYNKPKNMVRKNIDRDVRIMQLKNCGKTAKEIASMVNKEFPHLNRVYYFDVNKIISELKKLHKDKILVLP